MAAGRRGRDVRREHELSCRPGASVHQRKDHGGARGVGEMGTDLGQPFGFFIHSSTVDELLELRQALYSICKVHSILPSQHMARQGLAILAGNPERLLLDQMDYLNLVDLTEKGVTHRTKRLSDRMHSLRVRGGKEYRSVERTRES